MPRTDLNLLIVLDSLLEECSVSKTARKLNVTPPAISKSLNKLRDSFQDQLLVRSGSLLTLTPLAMKLRPQIRSLINNIESVLNQNLSFEIGKTPLTFNIASNDVMIAMLNSGLVQDLTDIEHHVVLDFYYDHAGVDFLRQDNIDLYIGESRSLSPEIKIRTIHRSNCMIICKKDHIGLTQDRAINTLANYDFISTKGKLNDEVDSLFHQYGFRRKIVGLCPGYLTTIETVLRTDTLAVVPSFLQQIAGVIPPDIVQLETDIPLPEVNLIQAWHPRHDNSPAHQWMRNHSRNYLNKCLNPDELNGK